MSANTDLTGTVWRDDVWLGLSALGTSAAALEYFSLSPFYDVQSNNELARRQGQDPSNPVVLQALPPGPEFVIQDAQAPHLFIIRKQLRSSPKTVSSQALYYILDGSIYQAPTVYAVLQARMKRCLHNSRWAFGRMQADLDPLQDGDRRVEEGAEASRITPGMHRVTDAEKEKLRKADRIIMSVLHQFPEVRQT
ncbi:hypothetical protein WJX72_000141 [[Myrmecia] bisecta]|uniref:Mediator of RNA polymerase II transcription subunit 6 n=1 Tax=[Myrmecia] bisecta TaxID=41462 RepID=A0AAW1R468_9CHLO